MVSSLIILGGMEMFKRFLKGIVKNVMAEDINKEKDKLNQEFATLLHDITYRLNVLKEAGSGAVDRVHTSDLNIATHMLDGYVVTNNSPTAGSVAWTDLNIVYKGTTYTITNGNSALKYIWWQFAATDKTKLQFSNTKPVLTQDDILIGINEGGIFTLTMAPGKMTPGGALMDGSVGSGELGAGAVTEAKIANLAITAGKIDDGAITETKIGSNAVTGAKILNGAVVADKLGTGAVTAGKIGAGAVNNANLFTSGVVGSTALGTGAVTAGKIASGAVNNSNIFSSGVVNGIAIGDGAVTTGKIGAGAVAEDKLNMATHFLF